MNITDIHKNEELNLLGGKAFMKHFVREFSVSVSLEGFNSEAEATQYTEKCITHFNSLSVASFDSLCDAIVVMVEEVYREEILNEYDPDFPKNLTGREILKYIYGGAILINCPPSPEKIGYHFEFNCEWEEEHGLEITIEGDRIRYIGEFSENPPWSSRLAWTLENLPKDKTDKFMNEIHLSTER